MKTKAYSRLSTGIAPLDEALKGGLLRRTLALVVGEPGAGKTTLAEQIAFHHAGPRSPVLYFSTLSEPTVKTLAYLRSFKFFDPAKFGASMHFVDLGVAGTRSLREGLRMMLEHVRKLKPSLVVVDSVRTFDDLAEASELRSLFYEFGVQLMARECTVLLLGEYPPSAFQQHPLFTMADGLIHLKRREEFGEHRRFLQVVKMRGTAHAYEELEFRIGPRGIEVLEMARLPPPPAEAEVTRIETGLGSLDEILVEGIPAGSTLLVAGPTGTGKTVLMLELAHRAANAGKKALFFSFEDPPEKLRQAARGLGLPLDPALESGRLELAHTAHTDVSLAADLSRISERIKAAAPAVVLFDSLSTFVNRVDDPKHVRRIVHQLAKIVRAARAVAFLTVNVPFGGLQISRFGVEETEADGVILLSSTERGLERLRHIEVYKLRNTPHLNGRHSMRIANGGIQIFPRYRPEPSVPGGPPPAIAAYWRVPSGTHGLDKILGGGIIGRSVSLVSGNTGTGKSILGWQFILEGARRREPGLVVALEEGPQQILKDADSLGLPLREFISRGTVEILHLSRDQVEPTQLLARLTQAVKGLKAKRLVLDSVTNLMTAGMDDSSVRELLYGLASNLKGLGVTSLFLMESGRPSTLESLTARCFSPIADNLLLLRYVSVKYELQTCLTVVKTRGSWHDRGTYVLTIGRGGLRVGHRLRFHAAEGAVDGRPAQEEHARR